MSNNLSPHPLSGSLTHLLQPQPYKLTAYSSLAAWHGGHPPTYPPGGQPATLQAQAQAPQPLVYHSRGLAVTSVPYSFPAPNESHRLPVPGSTSQDSPKANPSTCVCGASFNAPRERERHWRVFKCGGSSAPLPATDLLVIPGKYGGQKAHEVDKKWLAVLRKSFEDNPYPSKEVRAELAWNMKVPRYAVDNWFWWERDAREMSQKV